MLGVKTPTGVTKLPTHSFQAAFHQAWKALPRHLLDGLNLTIRLRGKLWPLVNAELSLIISIDLCDPNRVKPQ